MADARPSRSRPAREYFESIVVAVILALFIRTFVVQAFKIPTGSMEHNLLVGDHLLVNKFVFAPTPTAARAGAAADARRSGAATSSSSSIPRSPSATSSSASSACRARRSSCATSRCYINGAAARRARTRTSCCRTTRTAPVDRVRRARALRPGDRARRALLHDGRQPRQLAGQPLLGLPAGALRQGPGADDLLVVREPARAGSAVAGLLGGTRWSRLFHQIH